MVSTNDSNDDYWTRKERNTLTDANECLFMSMEFWQWVAREIHRKEKEEYSEVDAKNYFTENIVKHAFDGVNLDDVESSNTSEFDLNLGGIDLTSNISGNWTTVLLRTMYLIVKNAVTAIKVEQDSQIAWTYVSDAKYWTGILVANFARLKCGDNELTHEVIAEVKSIIATEHANARHIETYELKKQAIEHWRAHIDPKLSNPKAADLLIKVVPVSHRKLVEYVAEAKRENIPYAS